MKRKQTAFDYVYRDLCEQMQVGRLACGDTLASMSQLCELYHVGIRTIKDVMRALREDGYIRTEERKPAVVIYQRSEERRDAAVQAALRQRTSILQVYETMALLLPQMAALSAAACDDGKMEEWVRRFRNFDKKDAERRKKLTAAFLYFLMEHSGNLLFRDLYATYELYAKIPLFLDGEKFESRVVRYNGFRSLTGMVEALLARDGGEIVSQFSTLYAAIVATVRSLLEELAAEHPDVPEDPEPGFAWNAQRGRDHFYLQIARDLMDKIGAGVYPEETYLPAEAALASAYGVCVATVRNALAMLNALGFAKTCNAKGTRVIRLEEQAVARCLRDRALKRDALLYLSALQLMAVAAPAAAEQALPAAREAALRELPGRLADPAWIPLDAVTRCIAAHQPLAPLGTILRELCGFNLWGYYGVLHRDGLVQDAVLAERSREAALALCGGDARRAADCLGFCYRRMLASAQAFLVRCGLPEAGILAVPEESRP